MVQEEQQRELGRQSERFSERITALEDVLQELQDLVHLINAESQKRLQSLLAVAHDWMEEYDRTFGRSS